MRNKPLLARLALVAALGLGGAVGVVLGVPGVSSAQTTTVPAAGDTTTPAAPAAGDHQPGDANCPNMGGDSGATGSSTGAAAGTAYRGGPGGRGGAATQSL